MPVLDSSGNPIVGTVDAPAGLSATFSGIVQLSTVVGLLPDSPDAISVQIDVKPDSDDNWAFKRGRTLPLRLQLFCGGVALTDEDVPPPSNGEVGVTCTALHAGGEVYPELYLPVVRKDGSWCHMPADLTPKRPPQILRNQTWSHSVAKLPAMSSLPRSDLHLTVVTSRF